MEVYYIRTYCIQYSGDPGFLKNYWLYYRGDVTKFHVYSSDASICGCKIARKTISKMITELADEGEVDCIEDAAIGTSTIWVYLTALKQYAGHLINVVSEHLTFEGRYLHEVILTTKSESKDDKTEEPKPVILIEAGQEGGVEPVGFALYLIQQLLFCAENDEMLKKVKWVILPCTNPDAMEFGRWSESTHLRGWRKNRRRLENKGCIGVDISRNFDTNWGACLKVDNAFSNVYPGASPSSENETIFIKQVLEKYKKNIKAYVSLRRDGHALLYPYAHIKKLHKDTQVEGAAADITNKVNQRASTVHVFVNTSIFEYEDKARCGHSVDYANSLGIPLSFEMRVFLGSENHILSKFQTLPRGYENTLRTGYFAGIRELYNIVAKDKQYKL